MISIRYSEDTRKRKHFYRKQKVAGCDIFVFLYAKKGDAYLHRTSLPRVEILGRLLKDLLTDVFKKFIGNFSKEKEFYQKRKYIESHYI